MVYLAGILIGKLISFPLLPLFLLTTAVALLALGWPRQRAVLLPPLLLLAGALNFTLNTAVVSPNDLRVVTGQSPELVELRGRLVETPRTRFYEQDDSEVSRSLARIWVTELRRSRREWQPATGLVAVSTPGVLSGEFFGGQRVEVAGILQTPRPPLAEGLFDYRDYLRHAGVYHQLRVGSVKDWKVVSQSAEKGPPVADRFLAWAREVLSLGQPAADESLRLLWAMTLGWRAALTGEVSEPFMKSGTMHIFAISGLHVALIAGILVAVLRVLRVSRGFCGLIVIPLLWFYTGVTGWQASAIRSTVMMTIVLGGWALRRPTDLVNSLAAAGLIILIWEPQQLFQASFQLSFFVVLSIALFAPLLDKIRRRLLAADPLLPDKLRPRWQLWGREVLYWVSASFTTSLAAWLGSVPLIAYYFHLFTPVSLLANVVVVPFASLALAGSLGSLAVGGWWPGLAELFNHSAWFFMTVMSRVSDWGAGLRGGWFWVGVPSALGIATYYALLVEVMSGVFRKPRWRVWMGLGLLGLCGVTVAQRRSEGVLTRLMVLPLNGGSAVYFDAPGGSEDMLVDCGNGFSAERVLNPFLHAQGVNQVTRLVLTHGDLRNIGGIGTVEKDFSVREIVTSPINFRSPKYREVVARLEQSPERWKRVVRGDRVGPWQVLHPLAADDFAQGDDASLVLAGKIRGARVLLLSDLGRPGQIALQEREKDLRADIVVTGLPMVSDPVGDLFLEAINPRVVVVVDSEFPATRRAGPKLRERLARHNFPVIYTRQSGAVTFTLREGGWELRAMDGTRVEGNASGQ